jgi:hypothetical protein
LSFIKNNLILSHKGGVKEVAEKAELFPRAFGGN